ncbi:unnamed protein product [Acanthoscelides obtectus]|uniref:Transposase n=1 Tax=Acanthoscelides obtectus TaxID=200917 RepID=A0A9P0NWI4_ACAOB|nr:unnamed protein product [Acanthoscelides obtectus]CAK1663666.1 hypothetical protein AOBTE_LOCUS23786 [Acanthoscelides obtectus]
MAKHQNKTELNPIEMIWANMKKLNMGKYEKTMWLQTKEHSSFLTGKICFMKLSTE